MKKIVVLLFLVLSSLLVTPVLSQLVEHPQISNIKINAYWETNGAKNIDIMGTQRIAVNLTQESSVESSAIITITGMGHYQGTETLAPRETKTIYIGITNPGEEQQINNVPITVTASDSYTGRRNVQQHRNMQSTS